MPRQCSVCGLAPARRAAIESKMLAKTSYATLARETEIGESSLRRHANAHMAASLLRSIRENESASQADLIDRLREALDDASAVRSSALLAGNAPLTLRAASATAALINQLMTAVGSDATTIAEDLRQAELYARTLAHVAATDHAAWRAIDAVLRRWGEDETAADLATIAAPAPTPAHAL